MFPDFARTEFPLQGLSQDLETGYAMLAIGKCLGVLFSQGDHNYQITTINMYLLIEIVIIPLYSVVEIILRLKNLNYMLEIDISKSFSPISLCVLQG